MDEQLIKRLGEAMGKPSEEAVANSRRQMTRWFTQTAPLIQWDVTDSPLGPLYIAASARGLCSLDFGVSQDDFVGQLDPMARTERNPMALTPVTDQLRGYFEGTRSGFNLSIDLDRLTPFQTSVLQAARLIQPGTTLTYGQVARTIGKPNASRAVGQALGRNPVPIVIPCHRVVASDGSLGGYSGGGGLASKRLLLTLEGAL
jgi:methylated-DNA-[protein]-cysteine S-methyltransferase